MSRFLMICTIASLSLVSAGVEAKSDRTLIEAARRKFTAFNQHDVKALERLYSSDAVLNSPDYHDLVGNKPIAETYRKLFDAIPDAKDSVTLLESSGTHVYAQFVLTGHWNGIPEQAINVRIISVYNVIDGHIVDDATYYDRKMP